MKDVLKLLPLFAIAYGCAQSNTDLESLDKNRQGKMDASLADTWTSFSGEIIRDNVPICNATYLGSSSHAARQTVESGAKLTDEGEENNDSIIVTALHCIKDVMNVNELSIKWANGSPASRVAGIRGVGDPTKARFDDVAVLYVSPPSGVSPFSPKLAANDGSSNVQIRVPKPSKDLTKSLLVLGTLDGKKRNTLCETVAVDPAQAGFQIECKGIDGDPAGLSGSIIVTLQGEPVGIFKGMVPGSKKKFFAHALAWGAVGRGIGTMSQDDNTLTGVIDSLFGSQKCKDSITNACLEDRSIEAAFDDSKMLGEIIDCTKLWMKKSQSGKKNSDLCGFKDPPQNNFDIFNRLLELMGKDDGRSSCTIPSLGSKCESGSGCVYDNIKEYKVCINPQNYGCIACASGGTKR